MARALKQCQRCKVWKPRTRHNFAANTTRDGYANTCRECDRIYYRERYELKREILLEAKRERYRIPEVRAAHLARVKRYVSTPRGREVVRAAGRRHKRWQRLMAKQGIAQPSSAEKPAGSPAAGVR